MLDEMKTCEAQQDACHWTLKTTKSGQYPAQTPVWGGTRGGEVRGKTRKFRFPAGELQLFVELSCILHAEGSCERL